MRVADLGEFDLIDRLTASLPQQDGVILGIGDDAAVLDAGGDWIVATCDAQVQGIHFQLDVTLPEAIGQKAMAVNLSDIAAMGARPRFALISLLVPPELPVTTLDGIYAGLRAMADRYGVAIVGGNVARSPARLVLDITLLGTVDERRVLRRDGARVGDAILVTGTLGAAAAGLLVQRDPALAVSDDVRQQVLAAQVAPVPRVAAGQWLVRHDVVSALDISDGLLADLHHLCVASRVGALIDPETLPIDPATRAVASAAGRDPHDLALAGGEDYELLFTVPEALAAPIAAQLLAETGTRATPIGTCLAGEPLIQVPGRDANLPRSYGWDHFATDETSPAE